MAEVENFWQFSTLDIVKVFLGFDTRNYEVVFDGSGLASGVYYTRLSAGGFMQTEKAPLMRSLLDAYSLN